MRQFGGECTGAEGLITADVHSSQENYERHDDGLVPVLGTDTPRSCLTAGLEPAPLNDSRTLAGTRQRPVPPMRSRRASRRPAIVRGRGRSRGGAGRTHTATPTTPG